MHMIGKELTGGTPTSSSVVFVLSVSILIVTRTLIELSSESLLVVVSSGVGSSARLGLGSLGALNIEDKDSLICSVDEEIGGNNNVVEDEVEEDEVEEDDVDEDGAEEDVDEEDGPGTGAISFTFSVWYCIE